MTSAWERPRERPRERPESESPEALALPLMGFVTGPQFPPGPR